MKMGYILESLSWDYISLEGMHNKQDAEVNHSYYQKRVRKRKSRRHQLNKLKSYRCKINPEAPSPTHTLTTNGQPWPFTEKLSVWHVCKYFQE